MFPEYLSVSYDYALINCEVELILIWFKNCVLINKLTREASYGDNPVFYEIDNPEKATFKITDIKLKENDIQLLGLKKKLNGTNTDHKCLFNLKITT